MSPHEPDNAAVGESTTDALLDGAWGVRQLRREIALLEAHIQEERVSDALRRAQSLLYVLDTKRDDAGRALPSPSTAVDNLADRVVGEFVLSIIQRGGERSLDEAIQRFQEWSLNARGIPSWKRRIAQAIRQIVVARKLCALLVIRLISMSETATTRLPLFAYGPELSEFRHRHR
ncbi:MULTISPECIES: hypothetical protein [unclassified Pseudomonas]|uniref:hypothetical protein n=1 Tax=unclassified Pseudomonas TaxID=196821 RepID=UPI00244849EA|nr:MULTISPECIES: hypothetical protein [unclassified Pseudomonas]MDG9928775.1 hypothetical protein [Pseudomonas sp. GD04042]MDH0481844.1 hypothetical protein [Pseudomonas sp. GD04015]MDH0603216.1 hypothetical protein [Pseudomonas sp. GD03869]